MSVNSFSGVIFERPLAERGVYQQPQHVEQQADPKAVFSKPTEQPVDTVIIANKRVPEKRKGFVDVIGNIAKFFVSLGEMTKASLKAIGGAAVTALGTMGVFWLFESLPKAYQQGKEVLKDALKHPIKHLSKKAKVTAGVLAAGVAAYQIIKGIIKTNQRTANVDHSLKTGHDNV